MAAASNKSHSQFAIPFFLLLLLVSSPLFARRLPPACFSSCHGQLFSSSFSSSAQRPASNLQPLAASSTPATTGSGRDRQFKATAHEVPSGPNPESNK
ncbi:hypothetical protein V6N13_028015 [Hibiscus sabdariffa]|uniref:Uncharacterized protein n=2 Tax=Hibiscus sabdariffa TaxID=183260 RepID=A0ABR1ZD42_9ROSI